jgi:hypothetical protein
VLPYWALRWVIQLRVLLLPLLAVWVPLFTVLPWLLRWRGDRVLERHYALLGDAEAAVAGAADAPALRDGIVRLEALRAQIEGLARRLGRERPIYFVGALGRGAQRTGSTLRARPSGAAS